MHTNKANLCHAERDVQAKMSQIALWLNTTERPEHSTEMFVCCLKVFFYKIVSDSEKVMFSNVRPTIQKISLYNDIKLQPMFV